MSPEPSLDATGIARRQFSTARKGYDPAEVRGFLHELSDLVAQLQRGQAHERERAERAESRAELAERLDEHRLVELLGEETARVLDAARDAAGGIRSKAEESAARMVREAQVEAHAITERAEAEASARRTEILAEADALRREAEAEVERRRAEGQVIVDDMRREAELERERMLSDGERARAEAEAGAEQIRASAREQGRRLVGEAQAVRERILTDLARRRRTAREQLERLNGARERLLAAYEVVRRTVDEATTELTVALPEAKAASEMARRRVVDEPEETVEVVEAELSVARMSGMVDDLAAAAVSDDELDAMLREVAEEEAAAAHDGPGEPEAAEQEAAHDAPGGPETAPSAPAPAESETVASGVADRAEDETAEPATTASRSGAAPAESETAASDAAARSASAPAEPGTGAEPTAHPEPGPGRPPSPPASEGDKWGIRLPRPRSGSGSRGVSPTAVPRQAPPPVPAPASASVSSSDVPGDEPATGTDDEGETGPYVDELFARIRSDRPRDGGPPHGSGVPHEGDDAPGTAPSAGAAPAPVGGDSRDTGAATGAGAVAVAVRAEVARGAAPDATPDGAPAPGAEAAEPEPETRDGEPAEPVDPATRILRERDQVLVAVDRSLGRRLKRALADEQNEVLDRLRRGGDVGFTDALPAADEHIDRYAIAATPELDAAARHGAALGGVDTAPSCDELAATLAQSLVEPLRARVELAFHDCDGDLDEVTEVLRGLYREWKANHIGSAVQHYAAAAFAAGAYGAIAEGAELRWLVDRTCEACPDCDDNGLAGVVRKGDVFPTGDRCAPAHPDCRCLVVAARSLDGS
ncbi:MAG: DivIVA domain-containing protein [Acidimicrobiales bacterium]|nr:DivIVA domain-containing protein [Acidimicrobiales bacterium]